MTLPEAEECLKQHLTEQYDDRDWRPALTAVMAAENDTTKALEAISKLSKLAHHPRLTIKLPPRQPICSDPGLAQAESDLMATVTELRKQRRILSEPTLEELVNPVEENGHENSPYQFEGGDDDIVKQVIQEMATEVIEIESDSEEEEDEEDQLTKAEIIALCAKLEKASIQHSGEDFSPNLLCELRRFRAEIQKQQLLNAKQVRIDSFLK
jgi:hypothetical protein